MVSNGTALGDDTISDRKVIQRLKQHITTKTWRNSHIPCKVIWQQKEANIDEYVV